MASQYIGTISKTHGIAGECILSDIDFLPSLLAGTKVRLGFSDAFASEYTVESCKEYKQGAIIKFKGISTMSEAEALRELGLFVDRQSLAPTDVTKFSESMIDMHVEDAENGTVYGKVVDIWQSPAHKTLVIENENGDEVLVPFVPAIVKSVDVDSKRILLSPPEGMFDPSAMLDEFDGDDEGSELDADVEESMDDDEDFQVDQENIES